jgi:hypothetical protein
MSLRESAESTAAAVFGALEVSPSAEQEGQAIEVIEQAIISAVLSERERCASVATKCCLEDQDMAHKIAAEMRLSKEALIANLSSLR